MTTTYWHRLWELEKAERLGDMLNDPDIVTMALPDDEDYGPAIDFLRRADPTFRS